GSGVEDSRLVGRINPSTCFSALSLPPACPPSTRRSGRRRCPDSTSSPNPPASAREATLVSAPVMIDNTPPVVPLGAVRRSGATAHVEWEANDAASALRRCEYSLDANSWVPMESVDGVIDSQNEKFALGPTGLPPGDPLLVIRAADSANNTGVAKVILK